MTTADHVDRLRDVLRELVSDDDAGWINDLSIYRRDDKPTCTHCGAAVEYHYAPNDLGGKRYTGLTCAHKPDCPIARGQALLAAEAT